MKELHQILEEEIDDTLVQMVISGKRKVSGGTPVDAQGTTSKYKIRPVTLKNRLGYQITAYRGKQVFHENVDRQQLIARCLVAMETMQQLQITKIQCTVTILVSKKGTVTISRKASAKQVKPELSHNRQKKYLLKEGIPVQFLIDLGVMNTEGKVLHARYDKYRQINRFLEFIEDVLPAFSGKKQIHIIDFGCGKSYLTFAMYYYLKELRGFEPVITGLDLKADVIAHCNELSRKYGYEGLEFFVGDIAHYEGGEDVDMVVTLHACDTATDYALAQAVKWNAKVILSVPCCQHELNGQLANALLEPVLSYGILKERFAAILTDGIRAQLLEQFGYETQILEFIDMEHTPKNLLIRAVRGKQVKEDFTKLDEILKAFRLQPSLNRLLRETTQKEQPEK